MDKITSFDSGTGFSIELNNNRLILRGTYDGLPLYESIGGKITAIAIVKEPAVEVNARFVPSEQMIYGPVMIPDLKIFRTEGSHNRKENCYWYFSAGTIKKLHEVFMQEKFNEKLKIGH